MDLSLTTSWEAWVILIPLAGAVAAFLLGRRSAALLLAPVSVLTLLAVAGLALRVVQSGPVVHRLGGWAAPLGIELHADGLSLLMLGLAAVVVVVAALYARGVIRHGSSREGCGNPEFWPLWFFFWGSINALFLSGDIFNLYVTLELLGLAAVPLIALAGGQALAAGMRYLLVALLGSLAYLLGVALLYADYGTLSLSLLGKAVHSSPTTWGALALLTVGLCLKTALFPLHFWLPDSYARAPSPVSALLAALATKASFYLLLRLWIEVFPATAKPLAGQLLGILAAIAVVWGSIQALRQHRIKYLLAYSSIAQIGYLYFFFPLAGHGAGLLSLQGPGAEAAWGGVLFLLLAHGCAKGSMFLAAGCMIQAAGSDRIGDLTGVAQYLRMPVFAFAMAGVTLMGLPPSGGFSSKWLFLNAALASDQWWYVPPMIAGGLLAAAYVFRVLRQVLVFRPVDIRFRPVPASMQWPALILALLSLLLGLTGTFPLLVLKAGQIPGGVGP